VPEKPGLGISINEDWVEANPWDPSANWAPLPGIISPWQQIAWP